MSTSWARMMTLGLLLFPIETSEVATLSHHFLCCTLTLTSLSAVGFPNSLNLFTSNNSCVVGSNPRMFCFSHHPPSPHSFPLALPSPFPLHRHFEVTDKDSEKEASKIFSVPDFVGDACKAIASRVRGAVAGVQFDDFHKVCVCTCMHGERRGREGEDRKSVV